MSKESFLMYLSFDSPAQLLTDTERGLLWNAVFEYARSGQEIDLPLSAKIVFFSMRDQLIRDNEKYQNICERNRENGKRGGRPKKPENPVGFLETQRNPEKPQKAQSDTYTDTDTDFIISAHKVLDDLFLKFWELYPKRNGKKIGKAKTAKLFQKLKAVDKEQILTAVKNYADSEQLAKDPERFLKSDYWRDWIEPAVIQGNNNIEKQNGEKYYGI